MAMLFMGGEDVDFDRFTNGVGMATDGHSFRSNFARASIYVPGGATEFDTRAVGHLNGPATSFWFSAQAWMNLYFAGDFRGVVGFTSAGTAVLGIQVNHAGIARFVSYGANGAVTVLATTAASVFSSATDGGLGLQRLDVQLSYGNPGQIGLYVNQIQVLAYSGNITATGVNAIDGFILCSPVNGPIGGGTYWSEIMVANRDTRTLNLRTHYPVATAPGHAWLGDQTDVNGITIDESRMISTSANNQPAKFTVSPLPSGNFGIEAVKVAAWAACGVAGPQHIDLGVNVNATDFYSADQALTQGFGPVQQIYDTNPLTGKTWTNGDVSTLEIIAQSKA